MSNQFYQSEEFFSGLQIFWTMDWTTDNELSTCFGTKSSPRFSDLLLTSNAASGYLVKLMGTEWKETSLVCKKSTLTRAKEALRNLFASAGKFPSVTSGNCMQSLPAKSLPAAIAGILHPPILHCREHGKFYKNVALYNYDRLVSLISRLPSNNCTPRLREAEVSTT